MSEYKKHMRIVPDDVTVLALSALSKYGIPSDINRLILFHVDATCSIPFHKKTIEQEIVRLDARSRVCNRGTRMPQVLFPDEYELLQRLYAEKGLHPVRVYTLVDSRPRCRTFTTSARAAIKAMKCILI